MEKTKAQLLGEEIVDSMLDPNGGFTQYGLTKRQYFAGLAMQGLLTRNEEHAQLGMLECKRIAEESVIMADKLLEELEKRK